MKKNLFQRVTAVVAALAVVSLNTVVSMASNDELPPGTTIINFSDYVNSAQYVSDKVEWAINGKTLASVKGTPANAKLTSTNLKTAITAPVYEVSSEQTLSFKGAGGIQVYYATVAGSNFALYNLPDGYINTYGNEYTAYALDGTSKKCVEGAVQFNHAGYYLVAVYDTDDVSVCRYLLQVTPSLNKSARNSAMGIKIIDGERTAVNSYVIEGSQCIKIRDIAAILNNTSKQFNITWNNSAKQIELVTGKSYIKTGTELKLGNSDNEVAIPLVDSILINGKPADLTAYKINGDTYVKYTDVARLLNFRTYEGMFGSGTYIDLNAGYTE